MRIALNLVNLFSAGGLVVALEFVKALARYKSRHEFIVFAPSNLGYESITFPQNIKIYFFKRKKFNNLWKIWFDFIKTPNLIRQFDVDVYISLGNHAPARLNIPKIVLFHNFFLLTSFNSSWRGYRLSFSNSLKKYFERFIFSFTVRSVDIMIAQTNYMKDQLISAWKIPPERIRIIPNALPQCFIDKLQDINHEDIQIENREEKFSLIYVSTTSPHKNHDLLISAAAKLKDMAITDVVFILTMDADNPIRSKINDEGLEDYFNIIGEIPQMQLHKWYLEADAMIFPSKIESFGNALIEGMAYGLPICAIDLPYAHAVCEDSVVYFEKDNVQDCVDKILLLKSNVSICNILGASGRERIKSFPTWDEIVSEYINIAVSLYNERNNTK
jgi:glycosyltransferase involved in cell wall biosynthesis